VLRLCRYCEKPTDEGYFHVDCGKTYQRERSRRRRARKGTTSQRGYDTTHQKLREIAIARHPYCTDCGTTADLCADHIVPTSRGGLNVLSNYEVRCRACNNSRMANEKRAKPRFARNELV
jgi:5-methylcytosine-specific restriction enzyme A